MCKYLNSKCFIQAKICFNPDKEPVEIWSQSHFPKVDSIVSKLNIIDNIMSIQVIFIYRQFRFNGGNLKSGNA